MLFPTKPACSAVSRNIKNSVTAKISTYYSYAVPYPNTFKFDKVFCFIDKRHIFGE